MSESYKTIPGRGLVTSKAIQERIEYLNILGMSTTAISESILEYTDIQNNIESYIGTVEIPVGIVGPLKYNYKDGKEDVFCPVGTLEGALVASMNRGARLISMCGGFSAEIIRQQMVRAPLFILNDSKEVAQFDNWIRSHFDAIKDIASGYSNHARLIRIDTHSNAENLHAKFVYTTGDAAGQNMTTTCTWHAILWVVKQFESETGIKISDYVLEGNGASDKKVSQFLIDQGRGIQVVAKCLLEDNVIQRILRTTTNQLLKFLGPSKTMALHDGMVGYNINVANAVAGIFVATGQDLASIHESSVAELELTKVPDGLVVQLTLFSLVIGTLGGGTQLAKQHEALKLMECNGQGKVERFASLIAGFAMGLELSTYAAIVSGEFAKAHEQLGRNKPADWLNRREINEKLLSPVIQPHLSEKITAIHFNKGEVDNGILMNLSRRVNRKVLGFIPLDVELSDGKSVPVLIKSKALDIEVIKGLHLMAASIDPALSDLISEYRENLEYTGSHYKTPPQLASTLSA